MATVLIPIPDRDFDPTEVAVSWQVLRANGHRVVFATESGTPGVADDIMVTGRGLDFWSALPVLSAITVVGRMLRANKDARRAYQDMLASAEYQHPSSWAETTLDGIDGLLLPGGHRARGMRSYIDSDVLHRLVVDAFARREIVGAICHGVLLAARSVDPATGHSVLYGHRTHGADLGAGAHCVAPEPDHPILGPRLLPHLQRGTRPAVGLHVRAIRSHPRPEKPDGLL